MCQVKADTSSLQCDRKTIVLPHNTPSHGVGTAFSYPRQLNEKKREKPEIKGISASRMTRLFPNGSFGRTHIRQIRRRRKNFMQRNLGQLQLDRARGANQANLTGMGHQALSQTKGSGPLRLRKHFHQNIHRDLHRLHACLLGNFALQKMDHLRQGEGQQQLLQDQHPFTGPPQVQTQRAFEQFEGHFDIPAPSIQACHIGHILEKLLPVPVLHQTHQIRILVGAVDSQPDQRIQGVVLLIQDVLDLIARLGFEPGDPVVALIGEILEPLETKVAQVRQDQTARGQVLQQQERIERAIAKGIGKQLHMSPLLTTYIKDRRELAHQQTLTFLRQGPGLFTELGDRAQLTLIDGHDAGSEGGQPTGALVRRLAAQRVLNLPEQIRKRSQAQRQQALTNQLSASREQRNKRAKRFEQQGACDLGWREALSDHHEHTAQQQVSTLQGDWTPPADRRRAFWSRGGQEILEKLQELIDQRGRISGGRGRKGGMLWHRRESFLMEIVVLEWILFFFPCLDKSFFNLIVTDGWKLVRDLSCSSPLRMKNARVPMTFDSALPAPPSYVSRIQATSSYTVFRAATFLKRYFHRQYCSVNI